MSDDDIYAFAVSTGMYTLDGVRLVISSSFKRFLIKHRDQIVFTLKEKIEELPNHLVSPLSLVATALWSHKKGITLTTEQVGQLVCLFDDCLEAVRIEKSLKDLWDMEEAK